MKMQLEEGQTRTKIQNKQQPHGFISISSRINTKSLARHGIQKIIQT